MTDESTRRTATPDEHICRLAVYGTLRRGQPNHHQLRGLRGRWIQGTVRGTLFPNGRGAALGYPAIVVDVAGQPVTVEVFESPDLPDHWARLDEFEGPGYRRRITTVNTTEGVLSAAIYELAR